MYRMIKQLLNSVIPQNIVICQCPADQLFANGKSLICSPLTNHDTLLNLVQYLLSICQDCFKTKAQPSPNVNSSRSRVPSITPEWKGQMGVFELCYREETLKSLALFSTRFSILTAEKS